MLKLRAPKINVTRDYRLFDRSAENRALELGKHRRLELSMKKYGFLGCFPIVCKRVRSRLLIIDGQHRFAIAETRGLPIFWIEVEEDFDIATINCTSKTWTLRNFADKFVKNGKLDYHEALEFAKNFKIPTGTAFALLAGTVNFGNVQSQFVTGNYKIRDRAWANEVVTLYNRMTGVSPALRNGHFLSTCMGLCRVEEFSADRLLQGAERCRDRLVFYSNREAYLGLMEDLYNFGRSKLFGLKAATVMAMRDRNPRKSKSKKAQRNGKQSKE